MSERYARKSSNKQVSLKSGPNGIKAPCELGLAKALETVAKSLPKDVSIYDQAVERLVQDYKKARREKGEGTQELNALFDKLYGVYVLLQTCPEYLDVFLYDCGPKDVSVYPGAPLSRLVVEFYIGDRSKRAIKYAAALPEAAMRKIKVGFLGLRLDNVDPASMTNPEGLMQLLTLKAMAKDFADRQKSRGKSRQTQVDDRLQLARGGATTAHRFIL
jgi:hypothetical protein